MPGTRGTRRGVREGVKMEEKEGRGVKSRGYVDDGVVRQVWEAAGEEEAFGQRFGKISAGAEGVEGVLKAVGTGVGRMVEGG